MKYSVIEANYPITFRKEDAKTLGEFLRARRSVVMIGMKRVGISNFLRFFLYHKDIVKTYIGDNKNHLFIPVDLNNLVEREVFAFWRLTLKRILDAVEESSLSDTDKKEIGRLFLDSIQTKDLFLTIDAVGRALEIITSKGVIPTIFFLRFDRIKDAITPEFFDNLQGVRDSTHKQLAYVFTSFRSLDTLAPSIFTKPSLSLFAHIYIRPARKEDTQIVFQTYKSRYTLKLGAEIVQALFEIVDGYIQYLQLALIILSEEKKQYKTKEDLFNQLSSDERVTLQSEELWDSFTKTEQEILMRIQNKESISKSEKEHARYLWDTGIITEDNSLFSPLFSHYLKGKEEKKQSQTQLHDFTKKEYLLFQFLEQNKDHVCEREDIITIVWPEVEALGVSDWAIDRLVARVRAKLKNQKSHYKIQTIKTRGYKLIAS